ncbi:hypothetical protein X777_05316 [Ooceraea biroi]|uniref:Uncharacterized protein n=1 Tax=Ooceraea biroi TaxID=2015173 RepID=A0A026X1K5_OOCBI|nr:hypothetical protein X777_05316 [Ooceraea biroi]
MEAELKRMNTLLEEIVRHQRNRDRPNQVRKPRILPISSIREMDAFEGATDDIFFDTGVKFQTLIFIWLVATESSIYHVKYFWNHKYKFFSVGQ